MSTAQQTDQIVLIRGKCAQRLDKLGEATLPSPRQLFDRGISRDPPMQ